MSDDTTSVVPQPHSTRAVWAAAEIATCSRCTKQSRSLVAYAAAPPAASCAPVRRGRAGGSQHSTVRVNAEQSSLS
jgi:hypothetical protein